MSHNARPFAALLLVSMLLPVLGVQGVDPGTEAATCETFYLDGVGEVCPRDDGHYDVTVDGEVFTTHGPDPIPDDPMALQLIGHERQPRCATDWYMHVLYGRPANVPDRFAQHTGLIRTAVREMNWVLNEDALESGGVTADYKVLCDSKGQIRVDSFVAPAGTADFADVVAAARAAGFRDGRADYTIFYDASHSAYCGVGHFAGDSRLSENNANNFGGDYGLTYRGCWAGRTPMHENGHNQGAVQTLAPDSDLSGHCVEGRDIMCYPTSSFLVLCGDRYHYDCDHDTYFDAAAEPGEWLASNWNIGSRLNRFIAFGDTDPPSDNLPPVAEFTATVDGHTVHLDASASTDADGDALTFDWDLGDGTFKSGATTSHTYESGGNKAIKLTVSDGTDLARTATTITIRPDVAPSVDTFTFAGHIGCGLAYSPVQSADLCPAAHSAQDFDLTISEGVTGAHVELHWGESASPAAPLVRAEDLGFVWFTPSDWGRASGTSPVIADVTVPADSQPHLAGTNATVVVRPAGQDGLVLDQSFTLCVTVLYGGATLPTDHTCA